MGIWHFKISSYSYKVTRHKSVSSCNFQKYATNINDEVFSYQYGTCISEISDGHMMENKVSESEITWLSSQLKLSSFMPQEIQQL